MTDRAGLDGPSAPQPAPTRHEVESTNGVTVAAYDFGGPGPAMVFCHATGFHSRVWDPIITELDGACRAVSIDLRGHGESVVPDGVSYDWNGAGEDVLAVIDHLELGTVVGVGHSFGGASLLVAEVKRPGTISAGWLYEPIVVKAEQERQPNPLAIGARRRREIFPSRDDAFERYMSRPPFGNCDPAPIRRYVDYGFRTMSTQEIDTEQAALVAAGSTFTIPAGSVILKCRGEIEAAVFDEAASPNLTPDLPTVQSRITVVASGDADLPALVAAPTAELLPNGTLVTEPNLTHFGPFEQPAAMAESIRQHLL